MPTIPKQVKSRFKNYLANAQNQIINAEKQLIESNEKLLNAFKYIACNIFGFNEQTELTYLSIPGAKYYYLGVKSGNEIKYIIEIVPPKMNFKNESFIKTSDFTIHNNIEWFVITNGTVWEIYRNRCKQSNEYGQEQIKECTFNFLDLNLKNDDYLTNLFILCKESPNKEIITDLYNRNQWLGYLNEDKSSIDYMILLRLYLYEGNSEKVHIPVFNVTYWSDQPLLARQNAEKTIDKYLKDKYGREFDNEHKFVTIASFEEKDYLREKVPVWW